MFENFTVFVLNLKQHEERLKLTKEQLKKFNINNYYVVEGVIVNGGKTKIDRESGCRLAHIKIIEYAIKNNLEQIIIFEDDIEIDNKLNDIYNDTINFLDNNKWNMFYFGGNHLVKPEKINYCIGKITDTYTTHSYAIHKSCYEDILKFKDEETQIDVMLPRIQRLGKSYCSIPRVITQRTGLSFIQDNVQNYDIVLKDS